MLRAEFILPKREKMNKMISFDVSYILPIILAFFIGRASIIDKLTPFGIAFIAAYILVGKFNIYIFASIILSIFTFHGFKGMDYGVAATIIMLLYNRSSTIQKFFL